MYSVLRIRTDIACLCSQEEHKSNAPRGGWGQSCVLVRVDDNLPGAAATRDIGTTKPAFGPGTKRRTRRLTP